MCRQVVRMLVFFLGKTGHFDKHLPGVGAALWYKKSL